MSKFTVAKIVCIIIKITLVVTLIVSFSSLTDNILLKAAKVRKIPMNKCNAIIMILL